MDVTVVTGTTPTGWEGAWDATTRTIHLAAHLPDWEATAVLAHEMTHARAGHNGHQSPAVERAVDETVAHTLLDHEQVARAEAAVGCHPGALADELEVPTWVITAYQRTLRR